MLENYDENQLMLDDDEFDEFEDATEAPLVEASEESKVSEMEGSIVKPLSTRILIDVGVERVSLPGRDQKIKQNALWTIMKDMVGRDVTKISLPVSLNEPLSLLQRNCELFAFNNLLEQASTEKDSLMRLALVSAYSAARFCFVSGRV